MIWDSSECTNPDVLLSVLGGYVIGSCVPFLLVGLFGILYKFVRFAL